MSESWVGSAISIDCGEILGTYQGHVSSVDISKQTVSIIRACRNGVPCKIKEITISAGDIKDLNILKSAEEVQKSEESLRKKSVVTPPNTSAIERTVTPGNRSNKKSNGGGDSNFRRRTNSSSGQDADRRKNTTTPKKIENRKNKPKKEAFSAPSENFLEDFDFEKNLALFDKQAVFNEIENSLGLKPDLLTATDKHSQKYKCDENVLPSGPVVYRQIEIPMNDRGPKEFVTDAGLVVPSISESSRQKLFLQAERLGFTVQRQLEAIGRCTAEMVLQLIGGSHRLSPHNAHQRPTVVILSGPHYQGAAGVNCARQLANHAVNVHVLVPEDPFLHSLVEELHLLSLTTGRRTNDIKDLPQRPVDIIINALEGIDSPTNQKSWYNSIADWCNSNKAHVLTLDPPVQRGAIDTKWSISPALPLSLSESCGQLYLCDVGIPRQIFNDIGIQYMSPFGSKYIIPLHLNT